jgi:site-specific DNA recombinase
VTKILLHSTAHRRAPELPKCLLGDLIRPRIYGVGGVSSQTLRTRKLLDDIGSHSVIPRPDSTLGAGLESMKRMTRAVLYARVSSDAQRKEGTIESQVLALKTQIAEAGHELIKEYIDDGITGTLLERPALEQLRRDAKTDLYDRIYFHAADRITREAAHQTIIIGKLLKRGKKLTIGGKDYQQNPENKLTLQMLGVFAEYERAKIIERTTRGRMHRLRTGQIVSSGHCIYGYQYVKKSPLASPALVIHPQEAETVRYIFEAYASGARTLAGITRSLEERGITTRNNKSLWRTQHIRNMLQNQTYAGTRYFNRMTRVKDDRTKSRAVRIAYRDPSEWIGVPVPAIVSREVFDQAQERMQQARERYRHPITRHLLSGLVECGECGSGFSSYRRYVTKNLMIGKRRVYHKAAYKCNWRATQGMHAREMIERCHNSEIATPQLPWVFSWPGWPA